MKDLKQDQEIRRKVYQLFRAFFFGERMSNFEIIIQREYLWRKY